MWLPIGMLSYGLVMGLAVLVGASPWPWLAVSFSIGAITLVKSLPETKSLLGITPKEATWFTVAITGWSLGVGLALVWFWGNYPTVAGGVQALIAAAGLVMCGAMRIIPPLRC